MAKIIKETYKKENGELVKYPLGADIKNVVITKVDENGNEVIKNTLDKELEIIKQDSSSAAYPSYSIENIEEEGLEKLTKGESISVSIRKLYKVTSRFINHLKNVTSGENHIPTGGKKGDILLWSSDGQAKWGPDENTTYSNFQGATANNSGKAGLVLAPAAGEQNKFLKGDGTWGSPDNAQYTPGTGISILNNQIGLATATITNTKGTDTSGTEIILPHLVFDEYGRVKNIGTKKHTLPNSTFVGGTLTKTLYYGSDKKYSTSTSGISTLSKIMLKVNSGYTGIDLISGTNNYNIGIDENILQFKKDDTIAYQINSNGSNIFNTDVSVIGLKSADKADRIIMADGTTGKLKINSAITATKLGNLINGDITIKTPLKITDDAGATKNIIETINPTPDSPTTFGSEVLIGGDGNVFIGAGESHRNLRNALANEETKLAGETYGAAGENMFVASDSNVLIYSAVNTPANRKAIAFDTNGNLHPLISGQELALGTATYPWANAFCTKFQPYANGVSYGFMGAYTQGTASTLGEARLVLGNNKASGTDNNSVGKMLLYGQNTGYTTIVPTNNTTSNITVNLPSTSGTLYTHNTLTTATDFDTIKTTGIYHIKSTGNTNAPTGNHGTLYADFDIGAPYQIFTPDNVSNCDYKRNFKSNAWTEWVQRKFTDTTYSNFVKSGSGAKAGLVPAPSTKAGTTKYLREDGTWQVPPDNNTTYSAMTAATASVAGKSGLVPAPAKGKQSSFLRGDGTWATPTNTKNTAGSNQKTSKLFVIGAESQADSPQTYSNSSVYITASGTLYSGGAEVITTGGNAVLNNIKLSTSSGIVTTEKAFRSFYVQNGLRMAQYAVDSLGSAGIYDGTNSTWILKSDVDKQISLYNTTTINGYVKAKNGLQIYYDKLVDEKGQSAPSYGSAVWLSDSAKSYSSGWSNLGVLTFGGANKGVRDKYLTVLKGNKLHISAEELYASKSFTTISDARAKTDEGYLDSSNKQTAKYIALWEQMPPRAYKLLEEIETKGENAKTHLGYYAQEVEEALQKAGLTEEDFYGLSKTDDVMLQDEGKEEEIEYFDTKYGLSYTDCHMLTDIKLRQVVNEILPAMQLTIDNLEIQIQELKNTISEMKGA